MAWNRAVAFIGKFERDCFQKLAVNALACLWSILLYLAELQGHLPLLSGTNKEYEFFYVSIYWYSKAWIFVPGTGLSGLTRQPDRILQTIEQREKEWKITSLSDTCMSSCSPILLSQTTVNPDTPEGEREKGKACISEEASLSLFTSVCREILKLVDRSP